MNKNIIVAILFALLVGGAIGYASAGSQYSARIAADAAMLDKAKAAFPPQPTMQSVSGIIQSIAGIAITIKTMPSTNPFEDSISVRTVAVTSATKIVRNEPKDPRALEQEMADFQRALQSAIPGASSSTTSRAASVPTPPNPFTETELTLSDLKAGDSVTVDAGKDVKAMTSFEAVKITLQQAPVAPAPAGTIVPPPAAAGVAPIVNTTPPTPPVRP